MSACKSVQFDQTFPVCLTEQFYTTRPGWIISGIFALSQKKKYIFQTFILFFFKVPPTYICTLFRSSWELLYSLCEPWSRSTAEVPIYNWNQSHPGLIFCFQWAVFSVLETNKSRWGQGLYSTESGTTVTTGRISGGFRNTFLRPWKNVTRFNHLLKAGPSCSKLTMSLVNDSLKFKSSDTQICWNFLLKKCE